MHIVRMINTDQRQHARTIVALLLATSALTLAAGFTLPP